MGQFLEGDVYSLLFAYIAASMRDGIYFKLGIY